MSPFIWITMLVLTSGVVMGYHAPPASAPSIGTPIPYVQQFSNPFGHPPSFGVQTGYDGYIVSEPEQQEIQEQEQGQGESVQEEEEEAGGILDFFKELGEELGLKGGQQNEQDSDGASGLKNPASLLLLPLLKKITWPFSLLLRFGTWLFAPFTYALLGGALTAGVCVFTPFCTLTILGLGLKKENVRSFVTQDRLASITNFVNEAISKFQDLQKKITRKGRKSRKASLNEFISDLAVPQISDNSLDTSTRKNDPGENRKV